MSILKCMMPCRNMGAWLRLKKGKTIFIFIFSFFEKQRNFTHFTQPIHWKVKTQ
jgi:hypothetical protein